MPELASPDEIVAHIKSLAATLGRAPSRTEFRRASGLPDSQVLRHFAGWRSAVEAAGLTPDTSNQPLDAATLLSDWAGVVRAHRGIPTRQAYRRDGSYSPTVFERKFGPWSRIPDAFREWAAEQPDFHDVVALLPQPQLRDNVAPAVPRDAAPSRHAKLGGRPTYGNPLDFRGLRHEPVNEQGVVFLFGMIARELGYMVEAVQTGFPDCEAKRQVTPEQWQRVRIEFEYESRNFRDHGHGPDGCDVIVCWRHNWSDCPSSLEVVELRSVVRALASND
jgi:hypothetical protein